MGIAAIVFGIRSKYDNTGVKAAKTGIKGLDDAVEGFGIKANSDIGKVIGSISKIAPQALAITAAVGAAVAVIGKVNKKIQECEKEFSDAEQGAVRLGIAVKNNANLGAGAVENLKKTAGELSLTSVYSQDDLIAQEAYIAGLGLTEDQIKKTLSAATELSAFNGDDLKTSVEALSKTYTGTSGTLGKMSSDFKNLTKEELKNGKAVDVVLKKYSGYSNILANMTLAGKENQMKKISGEIAQSFGGIFGTVKSAMLDKLLPVFLKISEKVIAFNDGITNVFKNFPEVVALASQMVWETLITLLKPSTWINTVKNTIVGIIKVAEDLIMLVINFIVNAFKLCGDNVKNVFIMIFVGLKAIFADIVNVIIGMINGILSAYNKVSGFFGNKNKVQLLEKIEVKKDNAGYNTNKDMQNGLKNLATGLGNDIKNIGTDVKDTAKNIAQPITDATKETREKLADILSKPIDISDEAAAAIGEKTGEAVENTTGNSGATTDNATTSTGNLGSEASNFTQIMNGVAGCFGEVGSLIQNIMSGNSVGIIVDLVSKLVSALEDEIPALKDFMTIITYFMQQIAGVIAPVIEPLINLIENALLGIINTVCQLLVPVLQILTPYILGLTNIIKWLYNGILLPVMNGLIIIFNAISNAFTWLWNGMIDIFNTIKVPTGVTWDWGLHVTWSSLGDMIGMQKSAYRSWDEGTNEAITSDYTSPNGTTKDTATSSGASASYTATGDTYVNIYYNNSFVNGDAEEIALQIRDEILSAEKKGK